MLFTDVLFSLYLFVENKYFWIPQQSAGRMTSIFENMFKCPSAAQNSDPDARIVFVYELVLFIFFMYSRVMFLYCLYLNSKPKYYQYLTQKLTSINFEYQNLMQLIRFQLSIQILIYYLNDTFRFVKTKNFDDLHKDLSHSDYFNDLIYVFINQY